MRNSFALKMIATARRLINKFGSNIKLVEFQRGMFNPDTGKITTAPIEHPLRAHLATYNSSEIVEGLIGLDDTRILLVADFNITKAWSILFGSMVYEIISIKKTTIQDTEVLYELQCRSRTI